jgi:hypothetical protein
LVNPGDRLPSPSDYDPLFTSAATLLPHLVEDELAERLRGAERVYENVYSGGRYEIRGGFGVIYLYRLLDGRIVTLRVYATTWQVPRRPPEVACRYGEVDRYFRGDPQLAALTTPVRFYPEALTVPGWERALPLVVMDWAGPDTLLDLVANTCARPGSTTGAALGALAARWRELLATLDARDVEHGDISPTNTIVRRADMGLTLIDYDFVWLRALWDRNVSGTEAIQRHYRHPDIYRRLLIRAIPSSDPFAGLVIYTTLLALAERPDLWRERRRQGGELPGGVILFAQEDLEDPDHSRIFGEIEHCSGREVRRALWALREACYRTVEELPPSLEGLLNWDRRADPPLEAHIDDGWLHVRWSWDEGWGDRLVLLWRSDAPPSPGHLEKRWDLRRAGPGERRGTLDYRLPGEVRGGYVALHRNPPEAAPGAIAQPPDLRPVATSEAMVSRTVRCALLQRQGADENTLEIWSVDGGTLPPLVVVRRVGGRPDRAFGHRIVERISSAEPVVRIVLAPSARRVAYPPQSELRVFPARPVDRWRVRVETVGTGAESGPFVRGRLLLG